MNSATDIRSYLWPQPRRMTLTGAHIAPLDLNTPQISADDWPEAAATATVMLGPRRHSLLTNDEPAQTRKHAKPVTVAIEQSTSSDGAEWYALRLKKGRVEIRASSLAGVRHACATLRQLARLPFDRLPALRIEDWPDFPVRGVMLDISRDKMPRLATLKSLIELFAHWKFNQLQLYMEHTFQYAGHERVWRGASALSGADVRELDAFCGHYGIELVPNQNSLGHMERWLRHQPYRKLAETLEPWQTPWGETRRRPSTLCPIDAGSIRLMRNLLNQLTPHFQSRMINVGCDEPFELGQGRSARACATKGQGRVYLDYLQKLDKIVRAKGHRMQFWADWLLRYPHLVSELPDDMMPLVWGYEANHPFETECKYMRQCGLEFYVCPGTSAWCSVAGRTTNMLDNIRHSARAGRRHGASGLLVTDWGDFGHHQTLPISLPGFAWAAAQSWCARQNNDSDEIGPMLDRMVFNNANGIGAAWMKIGRVHELSQRTIHNRSVFYSMLVEPLTAPPTENTPTIARLNAMLKKVKAARNRAKKIAVTDTLLGDEWTLTLDVLEHACHRGLLRLQHQAHSAAKSKTLRAELQAQLQSIINLHQSVWLRRNHRGGLKDSTAWYRNMLKEYQEQA